MPQTVTDQQLEVASHSRFKSFDWILGFFLGFPIALPAPPFYWVAFMCFLAVSLRRPLTLTREFIISAIVVMILILVALVSNAVGSLSKNLELSRVVTTSFFFVLFLFAYLVKSKRDLLDGFVMAMTVWSILILFLAAYLRIYDHGILLFTVPDFRLWGSGYFPDWPNFLAFMLSLAFLLNAIVFKRPVLAAIQLMAALLTTSRTPLLAIAFWLLAITLSRRGFRGLAWLMLSGALIALISVLVINLTEFNGDLADRLLVTEDRDEIYSFALDLFLKSPILGQGSILFDESIGFSGHASFHNSYFDIGVRHGGIALLLFFLLLLPARVNFRLGGIKFLMIVLFFLIGALVQNFLKHPHIVLLYVVIINSGFIFYVEE